MGSGGEIDITKRHIRPLSSMDCGGYRRLGPKPFRINNNWFLNKDFLKFIKEEWEMTQIQARGDYVIKEKLRLLKGIIKWWNINIFGKIDLETKEGVR